MLKTLVVADNLYIILDDLIYAFTKLPRVKGLFYEAYKVSIYEKESMKLLEEEEIGGWEAKMIENIIVESRKNSKNEVLVEL